MQLPDPFNPDRIIDTTDLPPLLPLADLPFTLKRMDAAYWQSLDAEFEQARAAEPHVHTGSAQPADSCPVCAPLLEQARRADAQDERFAA
jgi:hypothetical protein